MKKLIAIAAVILFTAAIFAIVDEATVEYTILDVKFHSAKDISVCSECWDKNKMMFLSDAVDYKGKPVTGYYYKGIGIFEVVIVAESMFTTRECVVLAHSEYDLSTEVGLAFFKKKLSKSSSKRVVRRNTYFTTLLDKKVSFSR